MSKLLERHQMTSLERGEVKEDGAQETLREPSLQEKVEEIRKRHVFNRPGSSEHLSLIEAKSELLALNIDSVEAATQLGVKLDIAPIYSRGLISLRGFVIKALATSTQAEGESVPTPIMRV